MRPTQKQLFSLLAHPVETVLNSHPAHTVAKAAMEGVWNIPVRITAWTKAGGLQFSRVEEKDNLEEATTLRIALALSFEHKQVEFTAAQGEPCLLAQAASLGELTSACGSCYLSIGEMFSLAGEKTPWLVASWRKANITGRNVALGEGLVRVWATDGQVALATWAGGKKVGIVELENVVEEKEEKAEEEEEKSPQQRGYEEAMALLAKLTGGNK